MSGTFPFLCFPNMSTGPRLFSSGCPCPPGRFDGIILPAPSGRVGCTSVPGETGLVGLAGLGASTGTSGLLPGIINSPPGIGGAPGIINSPSYSGFVPGIIKPLGVGGSASLFSTSRIKESNTSSSSGSSPISPTLLLAFSSAWVSRNATFLARVKATGSPVVNFSRASCCLTCEYAPVRASNLLSINSSKLIPKT